MDRYQKSKIITDLQKKMVFLAGPRQAGKTTLAIDIAKNFKSYQYLNYDNLQDRKIIKNISWSQETELIILDEIHKMDNWKNYLKGVYDTKDKQQKLLITGSARLEIFNQVGDSLAGRYFLHRLLPLSLSELKSINMDLDIDRLLERGCFPEPYLAANDIDAKRWRMQYVSSLLQTDVLDFENIQSIKAIKLVFELLRERVGSPISYSSIAQDVGISPNTVKKYIAILEALYIVFRVTPMSKNISRSLIKEPKIYFFDVGLVKGSDSIKFENLVGVSLLKHVYGKIDYLAEDYMLCYLRTKEQKEVDFALVKENKIEQLIEVKYANNKISSNLSYFKNKYDLPATQVVKTLKHNESKNNIKVVDAVSFLQNLYM